MKSLLLAATALVCAAQCQAASIVVSKTQCNQQFSCMWAAIDIRGDLKSGDTAAFEKATANYGCAMVWLYSDGGEAAVGVNIGQIIRNKKYSTAVADWARCTSTCAIVWAAGVQRYIMQGGQVGFHAVYWDDYSDLGLRGNGECNVSSSGNAAVGAYLGWLGYSYKAIRWMTAAPPISMNWLSREMAAMYEVPYTTPQWK